MKAARLLCFLFLASCSVKEARDSCPCQVAIDLSDFAKVSQRVRVKVGTERFQRSLTGEDSLRLQLSIVRGEGSLPVAVWSGLKAMTERDDTVRAQGVNTCDSLYLFHHAGEDPGENLRLKAVPHKQFASVFLSIQAEPDREAPSQIRVRSDSNGLALPDGAPVEGTLEIRADGKGKYHFRLPRQRRSSLIVLEMEGADGLQKSYPLGEWILDSGYDWEAEDLDDLVIGMDLAQWDILVEVLPWEAGPLLWEMF